MVAIRCKGVPRCEVFDTPHSTYPRAEKSPRGIVQMYERTWQRAHIIKATPSHNNKVRTTKSEGLFGRLRTRPARKGSRIAFRNRRCLVTPLPRCLVCYGPGCCRACVASRGRFSAPTPLRSVVPRLMARADAAVLAGARRHVTRIGGSTDGYGKGL